MFGAFFERVFDFDFTVLGAFLTVTVSEAKIAFSFAILSLAFVFGFANSPVSNQTMRECSRINLGVTFFKRLIVPSVTFLGFVGILTSSTT